jgi:hypothetical protein
LQEGSNIDRPPYDHPFVVLALPESYCRYGTARDSNAYCISMLRGDAIQCSRRVPGGVSGRALRLPPRVIKRRQQGIAKGPDHSPAIDVDALDHLV